MLSFGDDKQLGLAAGLRVDFRQRLAVVEGNQRIGGAVNQEQRNCTLPGGLERGSRAALTVEISAPRQQVIEQRPIPAGKPVAGAAVPNINERSASTTVELADGESIAIAGLYRNNSSTSKAGIPVLRDIPLWGALFGTHHRQDRSAELIIVVTPKIVRGFAAAARNGTPGTAGATARRLGNELYF